MDYIYTCVYVYIWIDMRVHTGLYTYGKIVIS